MFKEAWRSSILFSARIKQDLEPGILGRATATDRADDLPSPQSTNQLSNFANCPNNASSTLRSRTIIMLFWSVTATYLAPTQGQSQTDNVTWQEGFGFGRCWPILETSLPHHHLRPSSASDVGVSTEILLRNLSCRGSNESPIMNK